MTHDSEHLPTVLVVEDDDVLAAEIAEAFTDHGIHPVPIGTWPAMSDYLAANPRPDLILLDQRLGAVNALTQLPDLRKINDVPVVFLTGNRTEMDRVIGLELGADDFLLKPIAIRELVARVRAHLRRNQRAVSNGHAEGWRLQTTERKLYRPDGSVVPLTGGEFNLLAVLMASPGEVVERAALSQQVLHRPYFPDDRSLDNMVHIIRRKCGSTETARIIGSSRNIGYVFTGFPEG